MENLNFVLPEIFISLSIMFLLVLGVFKKDSSKLIFNISLLVLLITAIITLNETSSINRITLFNNSIVIDYMASLMKIITLVGAFLVLLISSSYLKTFKIFKIEYPILMLCAVLGMMVMISSNDLMVFYMGLELQSLALYVLATFNRDQLKSSEAGLKYFVLSALSSGLLLYGCSLIYGFSGSTNFDVISTQLNSKEYVLTFGIVFILVGLAFKISAVPFHMWAPGVYEGSPTLELIDGVQNLLPHGVEPDLQNASSNLVDAYKKCELEQDTGLGIYSLSSIIVDKAEPSEALKANVVWSIGLAQSKKLVSSLQLDNFRRGDKVYQEIDIKAEKGAYFLNDTIYLKPGAIEEWTLVANVNQSISDIVSIKTNIKSNTTILEDVISDVKVGSANLRSLVGAADGLQMTNDRLKNIRHFANTMFNIMRGGIFDNNYTIDKDDFIKYIANANMQL